MRIFYGAAIQGERDRGERASLHRTLIDIIKAEGNEIVGEHTTGRNIAETAAHLKKIIPNLPETDRERRIAVRNKMIEYIESDIDAAIFEVSTPSHGTGMEIAHAYLRPRMGIREIPILTLYQHDYWPHKLSTMVQGLSTEAFPNIQQREYRNTEEAAQYVQEFLRYMQTKVSASIRQQTI